MIRFRVWNLRDRKWEDGYGRRLLFVTWRGADDYAADLAAGRAANATGEDFREHYANLRIARVDDMGICIDAHPGGAIA